MCLAVPVQVTELLDDGMATVEIGGVRQTVSLALVEDVAAGDFVIVHTGFAIARLDVEEAERTLALFREIAEVIGEPADAVRRRIS